MLFIPVNEGVWVAAGETFVAIKIHQFYDEDLAQAGYRLAAAISILTNSLKKQEVYDLGEAVKGFLK